LVGNNGEYKIWRRRYIWDWRKKWRNIEIEGMKKQQQHIYREAFEYDRLFLKQFWENVHVKWLRKSRLQNGYLPIKFLTVNNAFPRTFSSEMFLEMRARTVFCHIHSRMNQEESELEDTKFFSKLGPTKSLNNNFLS
jgi:hypothetical protein